MRDGRGGVTTALRRTASGVADQVLVPDTSLPRADVIAVLVALPLAAWVAVLRASPTLATTTVWAEDGREFLSDAVNHGVAGSLFRTYNGYMHLAPRVVAAIAGVRLSEAALVFGGLSCLIVAGLGGFVYFAARPHITSRALRGVVAASVVLLPIASAETLANAANLHWFLIFAAFWALVWVPTGWHMRLAAAAIVFFALTSDPFPLVFVPLVLLRLVKPLPLRDKLCVPLAFAVGAGIQLLGMVTSTRPKPPPSYVGALKLYPLRVILTTATGFDFPTHLFTRFGWAAVAGAAFGGAVVLAAIFFLGDRRSVALPVIALGVSVAMFVLYAGIRFTDGLLPTRGEPAFHTDSRYSVTPSLLLLSAVAILLSRIRLDKLRVFTAGAFVAIVAWTWLIDFRVDTTRGAAPTWAGSLRDAQKACDDGAGRAFVEVQPLSRPVPWGVDVPCTALK